MNEYIKYIHPPVAFKKVLLNQIKIETKLIGLTPVNITGSLRPAHNFVPKIPKLIEKKNHKKSENVGRTKVVS